MAEIPIVRSSPPGWTRRRTELDERIRELHARNDQLDRDARDNGGHTAGSTAAHVRRAELLARQSRARAVESYQRAATLRLRSALAHDRAASSYEGLAACDGTHATAHRDRAEQHRRLAATDRAAAADLFRAYEVELAEGLQPPA